MNRLACLSAAVLLTATFSAWGGGLCCSKGPRPEPEAYCPDCNCPCDKGIHHCWAWKSEEAHKLIEELSSCDFCDRIQAAKKLGCRVHGDFCCDPEILAALTHALLCDTCWEVRHAAAWSIAYQKARVPQGVLALYLASKIDPHYVVRAGASDALEVLLLDKRACFKDLLGAADVLAAQLKGKYKPTSGDCINLINSFCGEHGMTLSMAQPANPAPGAP